VDTISQNVKVFPVPVPIQIYNYFNHTKFTGQSSVLGYPIFCLFSKCWHAVYSWVEAKARAAGVGAAGACAASKYLPGAAYK
jgi:hypothetical protein